MKKLISAYKMFWGKQPRFQRKRSIHVPEALIYLGEAVKIEYMCNKSNGGGDGKKAIYVHTFETPVKLYMDETKKKQLYLIGSQLKVTKHGIEN